MKAELIGMTVAVDDDLMFGNASDLCGLAAATCTGSDNRERSLKGALSCGHESVIEHAQYTFKVEGVSRRLLAQITRHRIASFSVKSQRYCVGVPAVVEPPTIGWHPQVLDAWEELTKASRRFYELAVTLGVPAEDAAFGLLEGSETEFVFSMNARELRHFLALRTCNRAQWQIRCLADMILAIMKKIEPKMFKDAGCGCMNDGCTEGKMACGHPRAKG